MSTLAVEETQLPLAADDFNALEQRVLRLVELVKSEREARTAAEARIHSLETTINSSEQRVIALEEKLKHADQKIAHLTEQGTHSTAQLTSLEKERDVVRTRVEKLLKHLDEITA